MRNYVWKRGLETPQSAQIAANDAPIDVRVLDARCTTAELGLLVDRTCEPREQVESLDEMCDALVAFRDEERIVLALALADRVAMQEHAVYSVLSPEGFASILWKDRSRAAEAAAVMRMNAYEILDMDIIDAVLEEGEGSASANPDFAIANVVAYVEESLDELSALPIDELLEQRYERFRKF